jgi:serine/threonine protein kinase/Tfp pilus assembly protein PilF
MTSDREGRFRGGDLVAGKYRILRELGEGGFAVVYLVERRDTGEVCALKTFRPEYAGSREIRNLFRQEATVWVELGEHPFIVAARWVEEFGERLLVEMDFIPPDELGRVTLLDYLAAKVPVGLAVEWAQQFCHGISHAYRRGLRCHRDIKPSNVLIDRNNTVKISDFGLARAEGWLRPVVGGRDDSMSSRNRTLGIAGTIGYIAPEVMQGGAPSVISDIYSFGVVLWQMVTGERRPPFAVPYGGPPSADALAALLREQLEERIRKVDSPVWPVIRRALRANPSMRFTSFEDMRTELGALAGRIGARRTWEPSDMVPSVALLVNKGGSLYSLGLYDEAIRCFERALSLDPSSLEAWTNKGSALGRLGRMREAGRCFDEVLRLDPDYALGWNNKGYWLLVEGRHGEALACFERALDLDPASTLALKNRGDALEKLGKVQDACATYRQVVEVDPNDSLAWWALADALGSIGSHEEALVCFDRALAIDPLLERAHVGKAMCLEHFGRALYDKATGLCRLGRYEEAVGVCQAGLALERMPGGLLRLHEEIVLSAAKEMFDGGRFEDAVRILGDAVVRHPGSIRLLVNLGFTELAQGRFLEARVTLDRALEIDGHNVRAHLGMALLLCRGLSRHLEARSHFGAAAALGSADAERLLHECESHH